MNINIVYNALYVKDFVGIYFIKYSQLFTYVLSYQINGPFTFKFKVMHNKCTQNI